MSSDEPSEFPFSDSARSELARAIDAQQDTRLQPSRRFVLAALGVGACALVLVVTSGGGSPGPGPEQAFAGMAVDVAEANPRVLVDSPGWSVGRVSEFEDSEGSMEFVNGEQRLVLDWSQVPAEWEATDEEFLRSLPETGQWYGIEEDTCASPEGRVSCGVYLRESEIDVLGENAAILAEARTVDGVHPPSSRFEVRLPVLNDVFSTIYSESLTRSDIEELLPSLVRVDVETWLSALPAPTVKPLERPEVIDEMLDDVPIPSSVDVDALKTESIASGRYGVGAQVTGAVACGWLDQWASAFEGGDQAAVDEAVDAMATSPDWDILKEMDEDGGWSRVIWEYAREMRGDEPRNDLLDSGGTETFHVTTYELSPSYAIGLGCESLERRARTNRPNYARPPTYVPVDKPPA